MCIGKDKGNEGNGRGIGRLEGWNCRIEVDWERFVCDRCGMDGGGGNGRGESRRLNGMV